MSNVCKVTVSAARQVLTDLAHKHGLIEDDTQRLVAIIQPGYRYRSGYFDSADPEPLHCPLSASGVTRRGWTEFGLACDIDYEMGKAAGQTEPFSIIEVIPDE